MTFTDWAVLFLMFHVTTVLVAFDLFVIYTLTTYVVVRVKDAVQERELARWLQKKYDQTEGLSDRILRDVDYGEEWPGVR